MLDTVAEEGAVTVSKKMVVAGGAVFTALGAGAGTALSAWQMKQSMDELKGDGSHQGFYAEQIAALESHKPLGTLTSDDFDRIAADNPILADAATNLQLRMGVDTAKAAGGAAATYVTGLAVAGTAAPSGGASLLVSGTAMMAASMATETAIEATGATVTGLDGTDAHSRIMAAQYKVDHQLPVMPGDVAGILLAKNTPLGEAMWHETGTNDFYTLKPADQQRWMHAAEVQEGTSLAAIASTINCKLMGPQQLAFSAEGQLPPTPDTKTPTEDMLKQAIVSAKSLVDPALLSDDQPFDPSRFSKPADTRSPRDNGRGY